MASQPFVFPPPPPPPPPASASTPVYNNNFDRPRGRGSDTRGRGRGRGGERGGFRGRGRGNDRGNHGYRGGPSSHPSRGVMQQYPQAPYNTSQNIANRPFVPKQAPSPAVPAFGAPLPTPLPSWRTSISALAASPTSSADQIATGLKKHRAEKRKRKHNQLGLTPAGADYSSSSSEAVSDVDEEAVLANQETKSVLQFEYKGTTATLRSPAEIAAWIEQRRARWPTAAKVDAHKKEQAQRKAERDKAREEAFEARRKFQEEKRARVQNDTAGSRNKSNGKDRATRKKKKTEDPMTELAKAEAALEAMRVKVLGLKKAASAVSAVEDANDVVDKTANVAQDGQKDDGSSDLSDSSEDTSMVSSSSEDEDEDGDEDDHEEDDYAKEEQERPQDETKLSETQVNIQQVRDASHIIDSIDPTADEEADKDDDDAPPDELARGSEAALVRMPASRSQLESRNTLPASKNTPTSKPDVKPQSRPNIETCRLWTHVGRCPLRNAGCRGAHSPKARGTMMQNMTLRTRLEEREAESAAERVLAAVRELGDAGFFADRSDG